MKLPKWILVVFTISVVTTLANAAILVRHLVNPPRPIYVAKELLKDREFKKAVEGIAEDVGESQGYLDQSGVTSVIEECKVYAGGKIKCD